MAIGRGETDKLYDRLIAPTLRRCGVQPVRIDRINHNDDIDDRIISEIRKCDFALADLTYARPSAYFEAGFAAGQAVPVIYSCRQDHFSPRSDDEFGNLRVHFDLQMKNIIKWSSTSDPTFRERLRKRIMKVIGPLVRMKRAKEREGQEARTFRSLSITSRVQVIRKVAIERLRSLGYRDVPISYAGLLGWRSLAKHARRELSIVLLTVVPAFYTGVFRRDSYSWRRMVEEIEDEFRSGGGRHIYLCSLSRIPQSRIMGCLPDLRPTKVDGVYSGLLSFSHENNYFLHVLDDIRSERIFLERISEEIKQINSLGPLKP